MGAGNRTAGGVGKAELNQGNCSDEGANGAHDKGAPNSIGGILHLSQEEGQWGEFSTENTHPGLLNNHLNCEFTDLGRRLRIKGPGLALQHPLGGGLPWSCALHVSRQEGLGT